MNNLNWIGTDDDSCGTYNTNSQFSLRLRC